MICKNCQKEFPIYPEDKAFYSKIGFPEPKLCPDCRHQERVAYRNDFNLYQRQCDLCHQDIISMYAPGNQWPIYCQDCWWGDSWDPLSYGQTYDPERSFIEQLYELQLKVPRVALVNNKSQNSPYCNFADNNKNCYLISSCNDNEDCYYGFWLVGCKDSVDLTFCNQCQFCYRCLDCINCYEVFYGQASNDCSHCRYIFDCRNCHDCLGCVGLRAQEYCIFNQKYSEADYHQKLAELKEEEIIEKFAQLKINQVRNEYNGLHNVNVSGDYLYDCHNIFDSFDGHGVENCRYCYDGLRAKDCYDICYYDKLELSYQCMSIGLGGMGFFFCYYCRNSYNVYYCDSCHSGRDLFGCVGLRRQDHCILNKKYSDDEYKKIKAQIIAEMEKAGEWGENFPIKNSFFAYNETLAQLYYPLTREEVLARGWRWHEVAKKEIDPSLPICTVCGKNFKIIEQEKKFYQKMNLSEPDICPACLRETLIRQRNPRQLWERICGKCGKKIKTTYAPDRSEKVYCEECYMKEVY